MGRRNPPELPPLGVLPAVRVSAALRADLRGLAMVLGLTPSEAVRQALGEWVARARVAAADMVRCDLCDAIVSEDGAKRRGWLLGYLGKIDLCENCRSSEPGRDGQCGTVGAPTRQPSPRRPRAARTRHKWEGRGGTRWGRKCARCGCEQLGSRWRPRPDAPWRPGLPPTCDAARPRRQSWRWTNVQHLAKPSGNH